MIWLMVTYIFGGCEAGLWTLAENFDGILRGSLIRIDPILA